MATKIATVSTVFAACDRLDAANGRWNREDVRTEVGGGGYVVIDPLIRAWRELKPLRDVAPTTPAELLHQVATTLESHITGYIDEAESRQVESQQVFDATVSELAERLTTLESELEEKEASLQAMAAERSNLVEALEASQQSLDELNVTRAQLVTENDGFRGQVARMESEHKEAIAKLNADATASAKANAAERSRTNKDHAAALAAQQQAMVEAAEQTENRLMLLLDQERQAVKESTAELTHRLTALNDKAQSHREKSIELEATIRDLTGHNGTLALELKEAAERCKVLSADLEQEKLRALSIEKEFTSYKKQHKMSGELGALQTAVAAMQAALKDRQDE